jgi:hypothetical protein
MDHREKVAQTTDKLRHTTDVIKSALKTVCMFACCECTCSCHQSSASQAADVEQMGAESLKDLAEHRTKIENSHDTVRV